MLVFIAGGGTGGHIYPGLVIAQALQARGDKILWLGSCKGLENRLVPEAGFQLERLASKGWQPGIGSLATLGELVKGIIKAMKIIRHNRPDVVVGLGGYPSAPGVVAGGLARIPVLLLEQNVMPGKANLWLARWARRIGISFPETAPYFNSPKTMVTGNPVRHEVMSCTVEQAMRHMKLNTVKPTLLVSGASQGARSINDGILEALGDWKDYDFRVFHLTGAGDFDRVKGSAEAILGQAALEYHPLAFSDNIENLYALSDLAVCRAGATTLAELTVRGLPAVLVPYPHAGAHQDANARWLEHLGGAVVVEDHNIKETLKHLVPELLRDKSKLKVMAARSKAAGHSKALEAVLSLIDNLKKGETYEKV